MPAKRSSNTLEKKDHNLYGAILNGVDGIPIQLEGRYFGPDGITDKEWKIGITGMAKGAIKEVRSRIAGAFAKYGYRAPEGDILINLSPAGVPKEGTSLDLPIAMICLQAAGYAPDLPPEVEKSHLFLGELSLHGEIRRVNGALPLALASKQVKTVVVPRGNEKECYLVRGVPGHEKIRVAIADTIDEVLGFMQRRSKLANALAKPPKFDPIVKKAPDFSEIKGQQRAKRALVIAAAGGHNVLMVGPPGEGKSLLASALPGILPQLSSAEKIELTKIYSAKGLLIEDGMVVTRRPFRVVHHTASKQALVGGGSKTPQPGEITLGHLGVVFMDELAEFSRATLETLRQPIEAGTVTISRVNSSMTFPARFTLVAAMNPCPCGYHGQYLCDDCMRHTYDPQKGCEKCGKRHLRPRCACTASTVNTYRKKISGPILDRIDLHVEMRPLSVDEKFDSKGAQTTEEIRQLVSKARQRQLDRFKGSDIPYNAAIPGGQLMKWLHFESSALDAYKRTISAGNFSTRATDRMAKISRTIADLDGVEKISEQHILEAAEFLSESPLA